MTSNGINNPFIKKFNDGGFFYIYDVNTNQIVEVEKCVFDIINLNWDDIDFNKEHLQKSTYNRNYFMKSLEEIKKARVDYGLFSNFRPKKVTMGIINADGVINLHNNGLSQIVIEITNDCNLNCAYCPTSGKYSNPKTFKKHMNRETCKKSVDFFCERILESADSYISFYGGEPLLRFDLIKETVNYVKTKYNNKKFLFNLTTNGTFLNKEILDFFIEHDFAIMISLDGPGKINDRYRRFKNGRGTFNSIMSNLEFIRTYKKEYYRWRSHKFSRFCSFKMSHLFT